MAYMHLTDEYPHNAASPTNQPGCFICGTPKRTSGPEARHPGGELLVNLGVSTDEVQELSGEVHSYKVAVICESCVREVAALIGCADPERTAFLESANQSMAARCADYEQMEQEFNRVKEAIGRVKV